MVGVQESNGGGGGSNQMHGLVEFDVTEARQRISDYEAETDERLSFTAFVTRCLAQAVEEFPRVQAYRDWRGNLVQSADVDVMVMVEHTTDGERVALPHVVKAANRRSLRSIHDEIRETQESSTDGQRPRRPSMIAQLPGPARRLIYRLAPQLWNSISGTVAVSSVGMFSTGSGWAISPSYHTLQLTVGGIAEKPVLVDGEVEPREYLNITVTLDHDVVDGAPAARFVERLKELIESAQAIEPTSES